MILKEQETRCNVTYFPWQVYIRNVRKPQKQDSHNRGRSTQSGNRVFLPRALQTFIEHCMRRSLFPSLLALCICVGAFNCLCMCGCAALWWSSTVLSGQVSKTSGTVLREPLFVLKGNVDNLVLKNNRQSGTVLLSQLPEGGLTLWEGFPVMCCQL